MTPTQTSGHNIYGQHTSREGIVYAAWAPEAGYKVSKRDWFVVGEIRRYAAPMRWTWKCRVRGCSTPNEFCTETGTGYKRQYDAWSALMAHVQQLPRASPMTGIGEFVCDGCVTLQDHNSDQRVARNQCPRCGRWAYGYRIKSPVTADRTPSDAADEEVELEHIAQACEDPDPEESERLFFDRLYAGWQLDHSGRLRPPKAEGPPPSARVYDCPVHGPVWEYQDPNAGPCVYCERNSR